MQTHEDEHLSEANGTCQYHHRTAISKRLCYPQALKVHSSYKKVADYPSIGASTSINRQHFRPTQYLSNPRGKLSFPSDDL